MQLMKYFRKSEKAKKFLKSKMSLNMELHTSENTHTVDWGSYLPEIIVCRSEKKEKKDCVIWLKMYN